LKALLKRIHYLMARHIDEVALSPEQIREKTK